GSISVITTRRSALVAMWSSDCKEKKLSKSTYWGLVGWVGPASSPSPRPPSTVSTAANTLLGSPLSRRHCCQASNHSASPCPFVRRGRWEGLIHQLDLPSSRCRSRPQGRPPYRDGPNVGALTSPTIQG